MNKPTVKFEREAALRWVALDQIRISPTAQRELNQARVDKILANLDLEQIGTPVVSERDDSHFVIDGQHRVSALKAFFDDDPDIKIQCWVYFGLTEEQEAERFLKLNDTLAVRAFDKFRIAVRAGREVESDIDRIVRAGGLVVSEDKVPGAVACVGTLTNMYGRFGPGRLARTLNVSHGAYGDTGLTALVLHGVGLALDRYGRDIEDIRLVTQLTKTRINRLSQRAEDYHLRTGNLKSHCFAAAVVDAYNEGLHGRSAKRVPSWWKDAE